MGKEKSDQNKLRRLQNQLNRCKGNGRMAYNLNQRIDTLKNRK